MKPRTLTPALAGAVLLLGSLAGPAEAQPIPPSTATYQITEGPPTPPPVSALQAPTAFDQLVAPIALYPDPLIAVLLPASTFPSDLVAASNYLVQYGDPSQLDRQPWDPSVRALAHYPAVVSWMVDNLSWTRALGAAFAASPGAVMDSVQKLRAIAQANGTLSTTPQQQVVPDNGDIAILPAEPDAIYVPAYDPDVVFSDYAYSDYAGPFINFGDPCPVGVWLDFGFDWRRHRVWTGDPGWWHDRQGWRLPAFHGNRPPPGGRVWDAPSAGTILQGGTAPRITAHAPTPHPMATVPNPPPEHYRRAPDGAGPAAGSYDSPGPRTVVPQERPRLIPPASGAPTVHSPIAGLDYVPPSSAPPMRYSPAPEGRPARAPAYEAPTAPAAAAPAETGSYSLPVRAEPAPEQHEAAPPPREAPVHESRAPEPAPEQRNPPR